MGCSVILSSGTRRLGSQPGGSFHVGLGLSVSLSRPCWLWHQSNQSRLTLAMPRVYITASCAIRPCTSRLTVENCSSRGRGHQPVPLQAQREGHVLQQAPSEEGEEGEGVLL